MGANAAGNTLYASYNRPEYYILEQTVVVEDETRVRVRISITPYITLDRVRLRLGHHKWYWSDATTIWQTFFATSQNSWVRVSAFKASGDITSMSRADGFVEIPPQTDIVEKGEIVVVKLF